MKQDAALSEGKHYAKDERGCWIWLRSTTKGDYGQVTIGGKHYLAHRYIYEQYREEIPKGMHVLHTCDVRRCINPDHLFVGTHSDNMKDMQLKGRDRYREDIKVTEDEIAFIKMFLEKGYSQVKIAKILGIHRSTLYRLKKRGLLDG